MEDIPLYSVLLIQAVYSLNKLFVLHHSQRNGHVSVIIRSNNKKTKSIGWFSKYKFIFAKNETSFLFMYPDLIVFYVKAPTYA